MFSNNVVIEVLDEKPMNSSSVSKVIENSIGNSNS